MVAASFAESVTDCADVYVPPGGVAVVVGGVVSFTLPTVTFCVAVAVFPE